MKIPEADLTVLYWGTVGVLLGFTFLGYILSRVCRRNDVADFLWGIGFFFQGAWALLYFHLYHGDHGINVRQVLTFAFLGAWTLRLSLYLGVRIFRLSPGEDPRYANWRREWGPMEPLHAFVKVFLFQGLLMTTISLPLIWILGGPSNSEIGIWDFLGSSLFLLGLLLESISDFELMDFKRNPSHKGKILESGLWKYCRHPNYLGEILVWWGFFTLSLTKEGGLFCLLSPVLITFLLLKVSGIPMLEKLMKTKGIEYENYLNRTPRIFPIRIPEILGILCIALVIFFMDFLWLGILLKDFYQNQLGSLSRLNLPDEKIVYWAAAGVYLIMAGGLRFFTVKPGQSLQSFFYGALFGFCLYGVYDLTNLSLISHWPPAMALVDLIWGTLLCGIVSALSCRLLTPRLTLK